ncbi:Dehydrogenase/reductase SDR family protein 7-like, partial [Durusdinium trenchii]
MGLLAGSFQHKDLVVMEEYFSDKVVWVTGASAGFGEALCIALCQSAKPGGLILSARRKDELERVRSRCLELFPNLNAEVLPLDLSDLSRLGPVAERAKGLFGRVDVLVNNGGVGFRGLGQETSIEEDQHVMNVDFFSGVVLTKALLPEWIQRQSGHVVQISSVQ